jgi:hypothetical protein
MIHLEAMVKAMPVFMKRNPAITLGHTHKIIGKCTEWKAVKKNGHDAIWIAAELDNDYLSDKDMISDIQKGIYGSFSIAGQVPFKTNECDGLKCWKGIPNIDLWSIALCQYPKNEECRLDS